MYWKKNEMMGDTFDGPRVMDKGQSSGRAHWAFKSHPPPLSCFSNTLAVLDGLLGQGGLGSLKKQEA